MSNTLTLTVSRRGAGGKPIDVKLPATASTQELFKFIAAKTKKSVYRLRITSSDRKTVLTNDSRTTLQSLNISNGDALLYKDLGPQLGWRLVYMIEYLGPLLIHPIFFYKGHDIAYRFLPAPYNSVAPIRHSKMQIFAFAMVLAHFLKRELETVFVHRFSKATMPVWPNFFKNVGHYWGLSGLLLAAPLYGPWYSFAMLKGTIRSVDEYLWTLISIWIFAQVSNFVTHIILRSLRPDSDPTKRQIPYGYGFNRITCPNYFFEIVAWLSFCALTLDPFAAIFTAVGTTQMVVWAKQKQKRYKKEFGDKYPRQRWVLFPGIL